MKKNFLPFNVSIEQTSSYLPVVSESQANQSIGECKICDSIGDEAGEKLESMIASQEKIGFQLLEKWESDDESVGAIMQAGEVYSLIMFHEDCNEVDTIYLNDNDLNHVLKHVPSPASPKEVDQFEHGPLSKAYAWESPEYKMAYFAFNTLWEVMEEMTDELKQQMASSMGLSVEELISVAEKLFTNNADPDNVKDDEITLHGE
ncbi:hypothetical protein [Brevibacillus centrosporus]|jgi:hypothetical protein|uniref:hypothetical protein n=1 Tax=Brevibacillus centrosporus TaxID=54910 RepID=UPI003985A9BE